MFRVLVVDDDDEAPSPSFESSFDSFELAALFGVAFFWVRVVL
jgi:hypothetical protein